MCLTLRPSKTHFVTVDEEKASARFLHPPSLFLPYRVSVFFDTSLSIILEPFGAPVLTTYSYLLYYLSSSCLVCVFMCVYKEKAL